MKKKLATALFSIATTLCAEEALIEQITPALPQIEVKSVDKKVMNRSYGYIQLGIADSDATHVVETIPSLGLGYRFAVPSAKVDVSASYTREYNEDNYFYTVPNVSYLRYFSPAKEQSFYYGAGLAWGGLETDDVSFQGLVPNATLGYELNRTTAWRSFVQFEVSQPLVAISAWNDYSVSDIPAPIAKVSFGLGF